MTFKETYTQILTFWPLEVDISDGQNVEFDGGYFPMLSKTWRQVEIKTANEPEIMQLMVWAIFCAYHKRAIENYQNGIQKVFLTELDLNYVKSKFEESLFDNESNYYVEIRKKYNRD